MTAEEEAAMAARVKEFVSPSSVIEAVEPETPVVIAPKSAAPAEDSSFTGLLKSIFG